MNHYIYVIIKESHSYTNKLDYNALENERDPNFVNYEQQRSTLASWTGIERLREKITKNKRD